MLKQKKQNIKNLFLVLSFTTIFLFILSDSAWADYRPGTLTETALYPLLILMFGGGKIFILVHLLFASLVGLIVHRRITTRLFNIFTIVAVSGSVILFIGNALFLKSYALPFLLFLPLGVAIYFALFVTIAFLSSTIASKISKIRNFQETFYKIRFERKDWKYLIIPGIILLLAILELWINRYWFS